MIHYRFFARIYGVLYSCSMKITVYEKPTCTKCREMDRLLRENGVDFEKEGVEEFVFRVFVGLGRTGNLSVSVLLVILLARKLAELVGNPLQLHLTNYIRDPKYETRTTFIETFHSDFELLIRTYAEGQRVFVFVDDLDRCEIPKAADLMQAINLLISDSAPVFYILGLDREKIAAGLVLTFGITVTYLAQAARASRLAAIFARRV
jgi:hypothetical protein